MEIFVVFAALNVVLISLSSKADAFSQWFGIQNYNKRKCIRAVPPSSLRSLKCIWESFLLWKWTQDQQLQNLATGMCIDVLRVSTTVKRLRVSKCHYRKAFQKFQCLGQLIASPRYDTSYPLVGKFGNSEVAYLGAISRKSKSDNLLIRGNTGFNLCHMGPKDKCLQTVGKIPSTGQCLEFLSKEDRLGYVSVAINGKPALEQFTISLWIKAPKLPKKTSSGIFSYFDTNNQLRFGVLANSATYKATEFYMSRAKLQTVSKHMLTNVWCHVVFTWSLTSGMWHAYIDGRNAATTGLTPDPAISGNGTLYIAQLSRDEDKLGFVGLITEFHIYNRVLSEKQVRLLSAHLHGADPANVTSANWLIRGGDWLSWTDVLHSGKVFGKVRQNFGSECTSFEELQTNWRDEETDRWECFMPLLVQNPRYIPDDRFTASSSDDSTAPSDGRASSSMRRPWCPHVEDHNSYLQVDLGIVKKISAIGTGMLKGREGKYTERVNLRYSSNGRIWKMDKTSYTVLSDAVLPAIKAVRLTSAVMARYVRFYPLGGPAKRCLSVEVYGCDAEVEERIFNGENGCASPRKPFLLMDLGEHHLVKRIQIASGRSDTAHDPITSFYIQYMAWKHWVPYQVNKKLKIFKGSGTLERPLTHVLPLPILARLVKIFPAVRHGELETCATFTFIGCLPNLIKKCKDCDEPGIRPCPLGYIGDGTECQDLDECSDETSMYCDKNSYCKNKKGSYECTPCRHGFIGDGKICQTSCEALGIVCDANSFCDVSECRCYEGFLNNGTHCLEQQEKAAEEPLYNAKDGTCPDGFFNCYGDVMGTLDMVKRATSFYKEYDIDECVGD